MLVDLQDATGDVRDIYITFENISLFNDGKDIGVHELFLAKLTEKQKELTEELKIQLSTFLKSDELKNIIKLIM